LQDHIQVYSDGSGHNGHIGAAAILFRAGKCLCTLQYYLGTEEEHTVYKAEMVGLTLAAKLITSEQDPTFPLSISVNNQAAVLSSESFQFNPGSYLAIKFQRIMRRIKHVNPDYNVTVRWVPGHEGVHGNEEVDKVEKMAAEGQHHNSPHVHLPRYL
jgi:ribonuclease HI